MRYTATCARCHRRVRLYNDRRSGQMKLERHEAPGQEHLPWEQRKPCGSTSASIGSMERVA